MSGSPDDTPARRASGAAGTSDPGAPAGTAARRDKEQDLELVGRVIAGKYRILEVLGQGGFGSVFLVDMVSGIIHDKLAMKVLPREFSSDERLREQFLNEIRVAMKMVTRYIVQIRDVGVTEDGLLYYTMDYVPGRSLSEILKERKKLPPLRALRVVLRVLKALTTAHAAGIIHRDLKPANIMIEEDGGKDTTRVLDFGIATAIGSDTQREKGFTGSPHYMPPEQFLGSELGFYTDLYSVGVILYECLGGKRPYSGSTPKEIFTQLKSGPPAPIEEVAPEVSEYEGLAEIIATALERNPEKRFQSAREFHERLSDVFRRAAQGGGSAATTAPPATPEASSTRAPRVPRRRPRSRRRSKSAAFPILLTLAAVAVAGVIVFRVANDIISGNGEAEGGGTAKTETETETETETGTQTAAPTTPRDTSGDTSPGTTPTPTPVRPVDPAEPGSTDPAPDPRPRTRPAGTDGADDPIARGDAGAEAARLREEAAAREEAIARIPAFLEDGRRAATAGEWNTARKYADEVLHLEPGNPKALLLRARASFHLERYTEAVSALVDLMKIPGQSASAEAALLLADASAKLAEPDRETAASALEAAWAEDDGNAEVAARLATLYHAQGRTGELEALLRDTRERGVRHETLDTLYREVIVEAARRRREEFARAVERTQDAFRDRRFSDAAAAGEQASIVASSACVQYLLVQSYVAMGELELADRAIDRLEEMADSGEGFDDREVSCRHPITPESLRDWIAFFRGRNSFLRYLDRPSAALLDRAEGAFERISVDRRDHPGLSDLVAAYRGSILALRSADLESVEKEFRSTRGSRDPEVVERQAEAYYRIGRNLPTESHREAEKRDGRIRELVEDMRRYARRLQVTESAKERRKLRSRLSEADDELEKLKREKKKKEEVNDIAKSAFDLAARKMTTLLTQSDVPADLARRGYFLVGRAWLRFGIITGERSTLRRAGKNFSRAEEAGLDTVGLHELWAETYVHRDDDVRAAEQYQKAYEKRPSPENCLRAADHYIKGLQRERAVEILEAGRRTFPDDAAIKTRLAEAKR